MTRRPLLAMAAILAAFGAFSQAPSFTFFQAEAPLDRTALKQVIGQVMDIDPLAEVFHSDDMTILQVKSNTASEAQLRTASTITASAAI